MNSPIKLFISLLFLIVTYHSFSQEENYKFPQDDHYGIFKIGYTQPIAIGDNFANKSFTNSTGFDLEFSFNLLIVDSYWECAMEILIIKLKTMNLWEGKTKQTPVLLDL